MMRISSLLLALLFLGAPGLAKAESATGGRPDQQIEIRIDATKKGVAINPFIYGQFIEHLGRCIYGGIWAEMLEDRKFYYPIGDDYRPYGDTKKTEFPVVSGSPWQVIGPAKSVTMIKVDAFVGEHSPQVAEGSGIRQKDLGVVAGKEYDGYIWLRAVDEKSKVRITLSSSDAKEKHNSKTTTVEGGEFVRFAFSFTPTHTTD